MGCEVHQDEGGSMLNLTKSRSRAKIRPAVIEILEPRFLFNSVVVNTANDQIDTGGTIISLRDAITMANNSGTPTTITFNSTEFATAKTITLNGTQLVLSNSKEPTIIIGPSVGVTINGAAKSRIFLIEAGVTATFSNLTLTNGHDNGGGAQVGGGAIFDQGILTLNDCTVSNNSTVLNGGGIDTN
jgi:hypothetical protein